MTQLLVPASRCQAQFLLLESIPKQPSATTREIREVLHTWLPTELLEAEITQKLHLLSKFRSTSDGRV